MVVVDEFLYLLLNCTSWTSLKRYLYESHAHMLMVINIESSGVHHVKKEKTR